MQIKSDCPCFETIISFVARVISSYFMFIIIKHRVFICINLVMISFCIYKSFHLAKSILLSLQTYEVFCLKQIFNKCQVCP